MNARGRMTVLPAKYLGLALAAPVAVAAVAFAPYTEPRAFTWLWATLLILGVRAFVVCRELWGRRAEWAAVGLALVGLAFGGWLFGEYATFAAAVRARDVEISAAKASGACERGLPISLVVTTTSPRFLANREEWVGSSLDQVSAYYGCALIMTPRRPPDS